MSSINRNSSGSSPFNVGRGPRLGKETSFHGHNNGIIHSATSRFACPLPSISPFLSTLHAAAGKQHSSKLLLRPQVAKHWVSHRCSGRREIWFIQSTLQKCSSW